MQKRLARGAGILLPVSSLPSRFGIGTLGREAFQFVDFLKAAGQKYWQVLPVGPTSFGDSPYQSFSAFAGNPYFIDLPLLARQGLLKTRELAILDVQQGQTVDYAGLFRWRLSMLRKAVSRRNWLCNADFLSFCAGHAFWLDDYALFMTAKYAGGQKPWHAWAAPLRNRSANALAAFTKEHDKEISFWKVCQYLFFTQWSALKRYANEQGILLIGDIPLYVAADSADVWASGQLFQLDSAGMPAFVAGVPPDRFSEDGQLWGNPLYDWEAMEREDFAWWRARIGLCAKLYDVIRIDHFIGTTRYYSIPAHSTSAAQGGWMKGPGEKLTRAFGRALAGTGARILAEDLGVLHRSVKTVLKKVGYPGMRVLLFAFDGGADNDHLPHHYQPNMAVYGGTHDNQTIRGCLAEKSANELGYLMEYLHLRRKSEIPAALLRAAYESVADLAIFQMQDLLGLDDRARMNTPSTIGGNWEWRLRPGEPDAALGELLSHLAALYGRAPAHTKII